MWLGSCEVQWCSGVYIMYCDSGVETTEAVRRTQGDMHQGSKSWHKELGLTAATVVCDVKCFGLEKKHPFLTSFLHVKCIGAVSCKFSGISRYISGEDSQKHCLCASITHHGYALRFEIAWLCALWSLRSVQVGSTEANMSFLAKRIWQESAGCYRPLGCILTNVPLQPQENAQQV